MIYYECLSGASNFKQYANFSNIMNQPINYSHGLFSLSAKDDSDFLKALPESAKLLSFFPISERPDIPCACPVSLLEGEPFGKTVIEDIHFIDAFVNRKKNFFLRIKHAVIFVDPELFHSMTMFTTGLLCALSHQIRYLTVLSPSSLDHLFKAGLKEEQEQLSELIHNGNLLISPGLSEGELNSRLAKY